MIRKILHTVTLFLVLFGVWYMLSGVQSPLFLAFGAASSAFATFIALRMGVADDEGHPFHLTFTAPLYWLWLFGEMVKSSWQVTRLVWHPQKPISPAFATLKIRQDCDLGRTIYGNSVTLTPGTVCVDVDQNTMLVHALEESTISEMKEGEMDKRVMHLTSHKPANQKA